MKRVFSGFMVILLCWGMLTLAVKLQPVKASGTVYIRADGSIDPPTAPITSVDNVTYILTDNINDSVVVERNNTVVEGAGYNVQGTGNGNGIELSYVSNVTVERVRIENFSQGIFPIHASSCKLSGNNITRTSVGIYLADSSNITMYQNILTDNYIDGVFLAFSSYNTISENMIKDNGGNGIDMGSSSSNSISGNNITHNAYGFYLHFSSSNSISGNNITHNGQAISLSSSSDNSMFANNMTENHGDSLVYVSDSYNNTIEQNTIMNNQNYGGSITLIGSSSNNVIGNVLTNNTDGIFVEDSGHNVIFGNTITECERSWGAIFIRKIYGESSDNKVYGNTLENNTNGIGFEASNNIVFHNNFVNNQEQVETSWPVNTWDGGYPLGGNYWSNYNGTDFYSGPQQDEPGSDGLGDTPYVIDENNQDHYPLMEPWPPTHELVASTMAPVSLRFGSSSMLTAIVTDEGSGEEASVELRLLINGTATNSTIVPILQSGDSYTLNYLWTPTVEGIYNVTAYVPPRPDEALIANNQQTIFVNVSAPEIVVSLIATTSLRVGTSSLLNATVSNQALSNETNVELRLLINGSTMNSTTISLLQPGDSYTLSYLWTTTVEGTYNVTAYASPVSGETSLENNLVTKFATATGSLPPGIQVGVEAGDWIKFDYTITGAPSGTPLPQWLKVEFLSVEGTNATVRVTMHMSDGTDQNATVPVDVIAGGGTFQGLSGFVIPANCTTGDSIYMSRYGNVTIAGETTSSYAGATRTVVHASFSQYGTQLTYYWDKLTGAMVEASVVSGGVTATCKATETNMWQAAPSGLPIDPIYLYVLVASVIVIAVGAAAFIVRRRKRHPKDESPQT